MAPCPSNALAVSLGDFSAVIYTDSDGLVSWLNYSGLESTNNAPEYQLHSAIAPDQKGTIVAYEGQIALVMFFSAKDRGEVHFRLYYIQKGLVGNVPDRSVREVAAFAQVSEIKKGTPLKWSRGDIKLTGDPKPSAFDLKKYAASATSPLAAFYDGQTIRVFFQKKGSNDLTVAYTESTVQKPSEFVWNDRLARTGSF